MREWTRWLVVMVACVVLAAVSAGIAAADPPAVVIGSDGETAPVFSYANAIRERVFVPVAGLDQDGDGLDDRIAVDIIRPAETDAGLKVPAIIYPSPYLTSVGGPQSQFLHTTNGAPDRFPGYYDNYFVPRGYAVLFVQANGTGFSTGCPLHGGPGDIASVKAVIDWLQGRVQAFDKDGNVAVADWDNGKAGMIGKSYDGTLTNGVAATGVAGLTTIVPLSAISSWYDYSRSNGIVTGGTHYPSSLSSSITHNQNAATLGELPTSRTTLCVDSRLTLDSLDGDATGDFNAFWADRDYVTSAANVHASVFESFGLNDDNVRTSQLSDWWTALAANGVPRKLWLSQEGHIDPFDYRRTQWVDTLHRWFDYWLQGVQNGIMSEPQVSIERSSGVWEDDTSWPLPATAAVNAFLQGSQAGSAGSIGDTQGGGSTASLTFTDAPNQTEPTMMNVPAGSQANRLVFLSPVLTGAVHLSGTPHLDLRASFNKTTGNLGVILVDYSDSTFTVPSRSNDGIASLGTNSCWGDSAGIDSACFPDYQLPTTNVTGWRVAKGILDAENRNSVSLAAPLVAGQQYEFNFPLLPNDYVFPAGHRVGVVIVSNYRGYSETTDASSPTAVVTVDTQLSKIVLPVVGGTSAARDAGLFGDVQAPTLTLPAGVVSAEATGTATAVSYATGASDNVDPLPTVGCTPVSGASFPLGRTTVHCTATDASGNSANGSFDVVVADTTAPTLSLPSLGTISGTSPDGANVAFAATASDLVDGAVTPVCSPGPGTRFAVGTTTVSCTATDSSQNTASGSFKVTVGDTAPPIIHVPGAIAVEATGPAGAAVPYDVHAEDLVDVAPSVTCAPASGSTFPLGSTTVHCTARDASRNESFGSFRIVVTDRAAPTLQLPSGVQVVAAPNGEAHVNYSATAVDAVDPGPGVTCSPASGAAFRVGRTLVDCAATDASGNVAHGSFPVLVTAAPAATQAKDLASLVAKTKAATVLGADFASVQKRIAKHDKRGACRELAVFTKDVRARAGKSVSRVTATVLLDRARRLSVSLGC